MSATPGDAKWPMADKAWISELAPHVETGYLRSQGWEDDRPRRYIREDRVRRAYDASQSALAAAEQRVRDAERALEISRHELERERFKSESFLSLVLAFKNAVPPAPIRVGGTTYEFVPPDPMLYLKQLRFAFEKAEANEDVVREARLRVALPLSTGESA
jgi:hypothetical protein